MIPGDCPTNCRATWDRLPLISPQIEQAIYAAILAKCQELKCVVLAIGSMPDHVHLLVRLHTTVAVADLLKEVKGSFTLGKDEIPRVRAYIERQKQHHAEDTFSPEWEQTMTEEAPVG